MKKTCLALIVAVAAAGLVWARQEKGGQEKGGQEGWKMPEPAKEHELLKQFDGTWDWVMKFKAAMGPDAPEQECKGSEVCSMVGGFWTVFDTKSPSMMGMPWHGHGAIGYDPDKKKYVGTFINNMSPYLMSGEGTADGPNKLTMAWVGKDAHSDRTEKMRQVSETKDKDHAVMTMYGVGEDGKEVVIFTINYTRKAAAK
ncbi:MAG TPA: DUF1579 domain-containing protein [Planctomycetota bacterium]|jgi:hypothetical protein